MAESMFLAGLSKLGEYFSILPNKTHEASEVVTEVGARHASMLSTVAEEYPDLVVLSCTEDLGANHAATQQMFELAAKRLTRVNFWVSMPCALHKCEQFPAPAIEKNIPTWKIELRSFGPSLRLRLRTLQKVPRSTFHQRARDEFTHE